MSNQHHTDNELANMNSDTPRTDALWQNANYDILGWEDKIRKWSDFARTLERELSALRKELDEAKHYFNVLKAHHGVISDKLAASESRNKELEGALMSIEEYWNGDNNEKAMQDACEHAVETARAVLSKGEKV